MARTAGWFRQIGPRDRLLRRASELVEQSKDEEDSPHRASENDSFVLMPNESALQRQAHRRAERPRHPPTNIEARPRHVKPELRAPVRCKRGLGSIDLNDTWHPVRAGTRNKLQRPPLIGK